MKSESVKAVNGMSASKHAVSITHAQLEEALEERVGNDRRRRSRKRPSAIVERRSNQRRSA